LAKLRHRVIDLAFSPDDRFLPTAGADASVCIWAAATGERVAALTGQLNGFTAVAWSPNGDRLLGGGEDGAITIWDTTSQQQVGRLLGHRKPIRGLAFLPNGHSIVSVSLDSLRVWRAAPLDSFALLAPGSVIGAGSSKVQVSSPSKVTGEGAYRHYLQPEQGDAWLSDEEAGRFTISINRTGHGTTHPKPSFP